MLILAITFIKGNLMTFCCSGYEYCSCVIKLTNLLVLLLNQFINLLKVAENKHIYSQFTNQILAGILKMPNAERVTQATPVQQVGNPVRYINI